jgi:hypothetical protein
MGKRSTWLLAVALALSVALFAAACGTSKDDSSSDNATASNGRSAAP